MSERHKLTLDMDAVWAAISRSKQVRDELQQVAEQVVTEASSLARSEAYDTGFYSERFLTESVNAKELRNRLSRDASARSARRRRGQAGKNRILDVKVTGDEDAVAYDGEVNLIVNTSRRAVWIEYGTTKLRPKFILSRASEAVAQRVGGTFERLYGPGVGK